jgi:hypothetical protein
MKQLTHPKKSQFVHKTPDLQLLLLLIVLLCIRNQKSAIRNHGRIKEGASHQSCHLVLHQKNSALVRKKIHKTKSTQHAARRSSQSRFFRTRRKVMDIFCELGRIYSRRAYRMHIEWNLYMLVQVLKKYEVWTSN